MTDARDRISGPGPEDDTDDPDAMTFFEGRASSRTSSGEGGAPLGDGSAPNAGYTGGLASGTQGGAGTRQIVADEAAAGGEVDEANEPGNLAQQDQ